MHLLFWPSWPLQQAAKSTANVNGATKPCWGWSKTVFKTVKTVGLFCSAIFFARYIAVLKGTVTARALVMKIVSKIYMDNIGWFLPPSVFLSISIGVINLLVRRQTVFALYKRWVLALLHVILALTTHYFDIALYIKLVAYPWMYTFIVSTLTNSWTRWLVYAGVAFACAVGLSHLFWTLWCLPLVVEANTVILWMRALQPPKPGQSPQETSLSGPGTPSTTPPDTWRSYQHVGQLFIAMITFVVSYNFPACWKIIVFCAILSVSWFVHEECHLSGQQTPQEEKQTEQTQKEEKKTAKGKGFWFFRRRRFVHKQARFFLCLFLVSGLLSTEGQFEFSTLSDTKSETTSAVFCKNDDELVCLVDVQYDGLPDSENGRERSCMAQHAQWDFCGENPPPHLPTHTGSQYPLEKLNIKLHVIYSRRSVADRNNRRKTPYSTRFR